LREPQHDNAALGERGAGLRSPRKQDRRSGEGAAYASALRLSVAGV